MSTPPHASHDEEAGVTICPDCGEDLEWHVCGRQTEDAVCAPEQINDDAQRHVARIRELNDALRTCGDPMAALMMKGQLVMTRGIASRGNAFIAKAAAAVCSFDDFTPDNDPHGEHDMAFLDVDGVRIFFKVDYYDPQLQWHSADPSNPEITRRVLTIGLADDY